MNSLPRYGSLGRTLSPLNPTGLVEVAGATHPARTGAEHIAVGRDVVVAGFDHSGLVVREPTSHDKTIAPTPGPSFTASPSASSQGVTIKRSTLVLGCLAGVIGFAVWVILLYSLWANGFEKWVAPPPWLPVKVWMLAAGFGLLLVCAIVFVLLLLLYYLFVYLFHFLFPVASVTALKKREEQRGN